LKFWWGAALAVVASSSPIKSSQLQPHLGDDIEKIVGVV
jgi:hypothetical protein